MQILTNEVFLAIGFMSGKFVGEEEVTGILGKSNSVAVLSSAVLRDALKYFRCDVVACLELEDEGEAETPGSHRKACAVKGDILTSERGARRYIASALAVFEDIGYAKPDYSKAEGMYFGYKGGEMMLMDKCVVNGASRNKEFFCAARDRHMCTSSRDGLGVGMISMYNEALGKLFQCFSEPKVGWTSQFMNYCLVVKFHTAMRCVDATPMLVLWSIVSASSICVCTLNSIQTTANFSHGVICAGGKCTSEKELYKIKAHRGSTCGDCESGKSFDLPSHSSTFYSGCITCSSYSLIFSIIAATSGDADAAKGEGSGSASNQQDGKTSDHNSGTDGNVNSNEGDEIILCKCQSKKSALGNVL